jgi:hypothetical protein
MPSALAASLAVALGLYFLYFSKWLPTLRPMTFWWSAREYTAGTHPEQLDEDGPVGVLEIDRVGGVELRDLLGDNLDHVQARNLVRVADMGIDSELIGVRTLVLLHSGILHC